MMYLNKKQASLLVAPFAVAILFFYFENEILSWMRTTFPSYKNSANSAFNEEVNEYLRVGSDMKDFEDVETKIQKRKEASQWIAKKLFYKKEYKKVTNTQKKSVQKPTWSIEAIFPKYNMVIINSQFAHKGSIINNAKIMQIKFDRVLLKTNKGLQWVHLFH